MSTMGCESASEEACLQSPAAVREPAGGLCGSEQWTRVCPCLMMGLGIVDVSLKGA